MPPYQKALGGFSYSCHVYTRAKQGLRTLRGGTEDLQECRSECGLLVEASDLEAVDAGQTAQPQSLTQ